MWGHATGAAFQTCLMDVGGEDSKPWAALTFAFNAMANALGPYGLEAVAKIEGGFVDGLQPDGFGCDSAGARRFEAWIVAALIADHPDEEWGWQHGMIAD